MRMRTIDQAHAELLANDPGCALTKSALRRMVIAGQVQSVRVGAKYLVDLDRLETYLFEGKAEPQTPAGIRRIEERSSRRTFAPEWGYMGR